MNDNEFENKLKERNKLAHEFQKMLIKEPVILEATRDYPEMKQLKELAMFYEGMIDKLDKLDETIQQIKSAEESGIDQRDKLESANENLAELKVTKSGFRKKTRFRANERMETLHKLMKEFEDRDEKVQQEKENVLKKGQICINAGKNADAVEKTLQKTQEAFFEIYGIYELRLAARYNTYVAIVGYLNEILNELPDHDRFGNQRYDINKNTTIIREINIIKEKKKTLRELQDRMIDLTNKSYGVRSDNADNEVKWTELVTKKVTPNDQITNPEHSMLTL